jgi:hypothetical protein
MAFGKGAIHMTTSIGYSVAITHDTESTASIGQAYRTKKSFVAVHFDSAGKGEIVFLPEGVILRVTGTSSCLREGYEVLFGKQFYNVFEVDLVARCNRIFEPARSRAVAA